MKTNRALGRLFFFLPLVGGAAALGSGLLAGTIVGPGALFAIVVAWSRFGALALGLRGAGEAELAAECAPFALFAFACGPGLGIAGLASFASAAALSWAFLLSLEDLLVPEGGGFSLVLCFSAAAIGAGALLQASPAMAAAIGVLGIGATRYIAARGWRTKKGGRP